MKEIWGKLILVPVIGSHLVGTKLTVQSCWPDSEQIYAISTECFGPKHRHLEAVFTSYTFDDGIYLPDCYNLIILAQSVEPLDCRAGGRGLDSCGWTNSNSGSYSATLLTVTTRRMFLIKFWHLFDSLLLTSANQNMRTAKGGDVKLQVHSLPWDFTGLTTRERFWNVFLQVFS